MDRIWNEIQTVPSWVVIGYRNSIPFLSISFFVPQDFNGYKLTAGEITPLDSPLVLSFYHRYYIHNGIFFLSLQDSCVKAFIVSQRLFEKLYGLRNTWEIIIIQSIRLFPEVLCGFSIINLHRLDSSSCLSSSLAFSYSRRIISRIIGLQTCHLIDIFF